MATPRIPNLIRKVLIFGITLAASISAVAQDNAGFDLGAATLTLSEIRTRLELDDIDQPSLSVARAQIVAIEAAAADCESAANTRRQRLETLFEPLREVDPEVVPGTTMDTRRQISRDLDTAIQEETECAGLNDQADALIANIAQLQSSLSQQYLTHRVNTVLGALRVLPEQVKSWPAQIRGTVELELIEGVTSIDLFWMLIVAGLIAAAAGILVRRRYTHWFAAAGGADIAPQMKYLFPKPLAEFAPLLLEGIALVAILWLALVEPSFDLAVVRLAAAILLFGIGCVVIDWATGPLSPSANVKGLIPDHVRPFRIRLRLIVLVMVASFVVLGTNWLAVRLLDPDVGGRATMLFLVAASLFVVISYLGRIPGVKGNLRLLRYGGMATLILGVGLLVVGYQNLAGYLIHGVTRTALALFAIWVLLWSVSTAFQYLTRTDSEGAIQLRANLGVSEKASRTSLGLMQLIADIVIWICFVVYLIYVWDESGTTLESLYDRLILGIKIGEMRIVPFKIISGIAVFVGVLIVIGWIKRWIDRRWLTQMNMERGAREALITLFGYVGFVVAVLVALAQADVDLFGLTAISAALALGIGFGMQEIANNFVSGLILLFERPIRTGDFVTVGEVEGFVRKVSIRATEIETMDNQNVLVPNSELVSGHVTNWVLRNTQGRLRVLVGVAYGSDVEKVREILESVAGEHSEVITDGSAAAPRALFMGFGDSSLDFELRARIHRIDRRFSVTSDLNFAIDDAFRKAGITIPFPQRDLHLISLPDAAKEKVEEVSVAAPAPQEDFTATRAGLPPEAITRSQTHELEVPATMDETWALLTDIDQMKSWLLEDGEISPRIGGRFAFKLRDGLVASGHIDVFVPPRRLRLVVAPRKGEEPIATGPITTEFLVREKDDHSIVRIIAAGFPATEEWQEDFNRADQAWKNAVIELEDLLRRK